RDGITGLAGFTGCCAVGNPCPSSCRWTVVRLKFGVKIAGDHAAAEAHLGGQLAALDREGTVEEGEAVDLLFVGCPGETAVDLCLHLLAPRSSLLTPCCIASGRNNEGGEAAMAIAEDRGLVDEGRRRQERFD